MGKMLKIYDTKEKAIKYAKRYYIKEFYIFKSEIYGGYYIQGFNYFNKAATEHWTNIASKNENKKWLKFSN